MNRLEARGTVRLALRQAGLDVTAVTGEQMSVVLAKVMPAELAARGVDDVGGICAALAQRASRRKRTQVKAVLVVTPTAASSPADAPSRLRAAGARSGTSRATADSG